jgi:beta-glucuronidase
MLYPKTNQYRNVMKLDGLWQMSIIKDDYLPTTPLSSFIWMAVPASYQDLVTDMTIKNHVGCLCYEKTVEIYESMKKDVIHLRIGAAPHQTKVYIDGQLIGHHQGGYLPHDVIIEKHLISHPITRISIIIDNRATFETLPMGEVINHKHHQEQLTYFDFANYSGIHRSVLLYSVPIDAIDDIIIETELKKDYAIIHYQVMTDDTVQAISIKDPSGIIVANTLNKEGQLKINHPLLWDLGQGNLYTLIVTTLHDHYEETFGIRSVEIKDGLLLLNGKSIYLKGFGMHEDHLTIGKGHSTAHALRDFNLLQWINANSFRTSHYPYDEEIYHLADLYGMVIINEVPAVGLNFWSNRPVFVEGTVDEKTLKVHQMQISELIERDKNHPSVIMYSVANEANTHESGAVPYFTEVFKHIRHLTKLPIMIVEWVGADRNLVCQMADVIGLNRYIGWYTDLENLQVIPEKLKKDLSLYHQTFHKPIMLTEFGADTIAGLHTVPASIFSEEYQLEFIKTYVETIKELPFVIGEHVWNFADFMTKPGLTRMNGNKKGVFTRDRQPKMVAHWLKDYWKQSH